MGQRLRVVGWLWFRNRASLEQGLSAFEARACPGYFDRASWRVDGPEARIVLDVDLPGDFRDLEEGFIAAYRAATRGYVDFFEGGKTDAISEADARVHGDAPVWRWTRFFFERGVPVKDRIRFAGAPSEARLSGTLVFADEAAAEEALAVLALRVPVLRHEGVVELRVDRSAFTVVASAKGAKVTASAALDVPDPVVTALCEALGVIAAKAKSGELVLVAPPSRHVIEAGAKKLASELLRSDKRKLPAAEGMARFGVVDPSEPLPPCPEAPAPKKAARAPARK